VVSLGNLGWEISQGSQVEGGAVVFTEVEVTDYVVACCLLDVVGDWDVGDVTVELGLDTSELKTDSTGVGDWNLSNGQPGCSLSRYRIIACASLSVPGSEGSVLCCWHGEEWGHVTCGEGLVSGIKSSCVESLYEGSVTIVEGGGGTGGVLHGVDLPVGTGDACSCNCWGC